MSRSQGAALAPFGAADLSRHDLPMYLRVADALRRELAGYSAGSYLPPEQELASGYGVNRHTLRRAVDVLIDDGLVLRHKGKGTCVLDRPIIYPVTAASTYSRALKSMGYQPQARLLGRRMRAARPTEAQALGVPDGQSILELRTLRTLDEQPVTLITHCFLGYYAHLFRDYRAGSVREHIAAAGLTLQRRSTHIGAQMPTTGEALTLMMPRQVPLLSIQTVSCDEQGRAVELSVSLSRADRFKYYVSSGEHDEFSEGSEGS